MRRQICWKWCSELYTCKQFRLGWKQLLKRKQVHLTEINIQFDSSVIVFVVAVIIIIIFFYLQIELKRKKKKVEERRRRKSRKMEAKNKREQLIITSHNFTNTWNGWKAPTVIISFIDIYNKLIAFYLCFFLSYALFFCCLK